MEKEMEKADKIFKDISKKLLPKDKGKIVAIDPESGKYAVGDTDIEAYEGISKKVPKGQFVLKRLGFASTYFVGAF